MYIVHASIDQNQKLKVGPYFYLCAIGLGGYKGVF